MTTLILFDFDGTFADTAPDMAMAANRQREKRGLAPMPVSDLRAYVSMGARGMVKASLGIEADHPTFESLKAEFLADYESHSTVHTQLFDGIPELLGQIREAGMQWGIVTNKLTRYAEPIVQWLDLPDCAVLVCGDTVAYAKPHPLPLEHAAQTVGFGVDRCVYVGDDLRDIQAAKSAGMASIAAAYGYCGVEHPVHTWQADTIVSHANEIWPAVGTLIRPWR